MIDLVYSLLIAVAAVAAGIGTGSFAIAMAVYFGLLVIMVMLNDILDTLKEIAKSSKEKREKE